MMVQPGVEGRSSVTLHQIYRKRMTDTTALPLFTIGSMAQSAGLVEIAVRLCLNQRKELCPHVWVPMLKPQRPCIRTAHQLPADMLGPGFGKPVLRFFLDAMDDDDDEDYNIMVPVKNRRVFFADSKGLPLTAVKTFSEAEDYSDLDPLPSLQELGAMTEDGYSCTVSPCCPGTRLTLGFPPPSADFQAFRNKLARSMVVLENCSLTEMALQGTVRVRNVSFQKDVRVRITFDSWQSFKDVPCIYLQERYGGPQTDVFEFHVPFPKVLDAKKKIEFCLRYLPDRYNMPFWDNNSGQNYGILISVSAHLCQGKTANENPQNNINPKQICY